MGLGGVGAGGGNAALALAAGVASHLEEALVSPPGAPAVLDEPVGLAILLHQISTQQFKTWLHTHAAVDDALRPSQNGL